MGHTVLLIDENPAVRQIARALLERNGFRAEVRDSADGIPDLLRELPVDCIVCDVQLTGADGFDLVRTIRGEPATANIPVILLTALDSMEDEFEGYLSGANAYLTKPFRARELLDAITAVLNPERPASGRRAAVNHVTTVMACVSDARRRTVRAAVRNAGFEVEFEDELSQAFSRIDREQFHLLLCDVEADTEAVHKAREFLSHFALALPVIVLHRKGSQPVLPDDRQWTAAAVPATPAHLAEKIRRAIEDFSGNP